MVEYETEYIHCGRNSKMSRSYYKSLKIVARLEKRNYLWIGQKKVNK